MTVRSGDLSSGLRCFKNNVFVACPDMKNEYVCLIVSSNLFVNGISFLTNVLFKLFASQPKLFWLSDLQKLMSGLLDLLRLSELLFFFLCI